MLLTPAIVRHAGAWLAAVALCFGAGPASAQDVNDARHSIDQLKQLPASVQKLRELTQAAHFGPFEVTGSCSYNGVWYCLGTHCTTFSWSWPFPSYALLPRVLDHHLRRIQETSSQFEGRYGPVTTWLLQTAPAFSRQLDAAALRLGETQAVLTAADAAPAEVDRAKQDVLRLIQELSTSLREGSDQLKVGLSGLASFNQQLNTAWSKLDETRAVMEEMIRFDEQQLDQQLAGWPCGAADARQRYNGIRNGVREEFETLMSVARNVGANAAQTDQAVSLILGTVLNMLNAYQNISNALASAQISPVGAVQQMRLDAAQSFWRGLSDHARRELGA